MLSALGSFSVSTTSSLSLISFQYQMKCKLTVRISKELNVILYSLSRCLSLLRKVCENIRVKTSPKLNSQHTRLPYPLPYELAKNLQASWNNLYETCNPKSDILRLFLISRQYNIGQEKIKFRPISGVRNFENFTSSFRAYQQNTQN